MQKVFRFTVVNSGQTHLRRIELEYHTKLFHPEHEVTGFQVYEFIVLMMKAELLLRTRKADEAAALVTQVRQRAFSANPAKASVTGADLIKNSSYDYAMRTTSATTHEGQSDIQYGCFLDELGWEFNQEGPHRQDLIRFGTLVKKA